MRRSTAASGSCCGTDPAAYRPRVIIRNRRLRSEQARARLLAMAPRWVPTPEVLEAELRRIEAGDRGAVDAPSVAVAGAAAPDAVARGGVDGLPVVPGRRSVPALVALLAGALAGAALVWLLAVPRGAAAPDLQLSPPALTLSSPAPAASGSALPASSLGPASPAAAVTSSAQVVVVDVQGEVRKPGVVELPVGSRVVDALGAAGGVTSRASTITLNLAQVLVDGTQLLVPNRRAAVTSAGVGDAAPPTGGSAAGVPSAGPVDLNTATLEQLDALPGIGPVLAQRILDYRAQNGPFTSTDQLTDVSGIGDATYGDLEGLVRV